MNFIYIVAFVVVFIKLHHVKKQNNELKGHIDFLNEQIRDLNDKSFFNYNMIKNMQGDGSENESKADMSSSACPPVRSSSEQKVNPYRESENIPEIFKDSQKEVCNVTNVDSVNNSAINANAAAIGNSAAKTNAASNGNSAEKANAASDSSSENSSSASVGRPAVNMSTAHAEVSVKTELPSEKIASVQRTVAQNVPAPVLPKTCGKSDKSQAHAKLAEEIYVKTKAKPEQKTPRENIPHAKPSAESSDKPNMKSFESWLGTRVYNIAASLMIFIGLILFCTLGYEYITDTMKMAAMFVVSGAFIALGAFFTRTNKSVFSLGLTGCGFGAFFISILLSHVYFHAITDITAFGLLLLWAMLALYMSKKLDSVMLSVTAHMGTAISICFAFSADLSSDKLILPVIYQTAAIAVIIIGNVFCCKKTYRFGLFMSLSLLVYTSFAMCIRFGEKEIMPGEVSPVFTAVIFAVQFIVISFVSYLISISTAALDNGSKKFHNIMLAVHIVNKVLWTAGITASVGIVTYFTLKNAFSVDSGIYPALAVGIAAMCHLLVTLFISEKLNFNETLSKISIYFNSVTIMFTLFAQAVSREILHGVPFLCLYVGFMILVVRYTKDKKLNHLIAALIGCDMVFMCFYGYFAAANVVISIAYMVAVGIEILLHWFLQSGESREKRFTFFKMAEYLWISVSIIPINLSKYSDISLALIVSEFALINIITYLCRYGRENEPELRLAVKIESLTTIYFGMIIMSAAMLNSLGSVLAIKAAFLVLLTALTTLYIKDFVKSNSTARQVISAATTAGFISAFMIGFYEYIKPVAYIYVDVLDCSSFFFIAAVMLLLIYRYNKNHKLRLFFFAAIGVDMALMLTIGYNELIFEYRTHWATALIAILACILHSAVVTYMIYYVHKIKSTFGFTKIIAYFWINISLSVIAGCTMEINSMSENAAVGLILSVVTLTNIVFHIKEYNKKSILGMIVRIVSIITIYSSMLVMKNYIGAYINSPFYAAEYVIRFALILLSVGLCYLILRDIVKSNSVYLQAFAGLTVTLLINAIFAGLSNAFTVTYIFSIVTMITSLACVVVGFTAKKKGLRVYGLIVVMLCVIKLVTIDISGADSLARVAAFVIGGIVCFIISGIYNKVESKLSK